MPYVVEVDRTARVVQGLPSPIRARLGRSLIPADQGISVTLTAGIAFDEDQLTERGWFSDTDATAEVVQDCCDYLGSAPWTELFAFRPTFELVARHIYGSLAARVPQLAYVSLRDNPFGTTTRYAPAVTPPLTAERASIRPAHRW